MSKPTREPAMRVAFCRSCDTAMQPGTEKVSLYSFRNRGQSIHLCLPCSREIGELAQESPKEGPAG